jgi:hypothetical protein
LLVSPGPETSDVVRSRKRDVDFDVSTGEAELVPAAEKVITIR